MKVHFFELFYGVREPYYIFNSGQFLIIIVSHGFLFHLPLLSEFRPGIKEFKEVHHHEDLSGNFVVYAPHCIYLFIQKLIPFQFSIGNDSYTCLIEIEEFGKLFMGQFGPPGRFCFSHGHKPAIP